MPRHASIAVFAPSPLLTITVEPGPSAPTVHLHAGGQGFWVSRLAAALGAHVTLCCALGGETGSVLRCLIGDEPLTLLAVATAKANGAYIHDRRSGERVELVSVAGEHLDRHTADELYGVALTAGLDADLTLVTGCRPSDLVDADLYRRLVADLRANGCRVMADLTGPPLHAVLKAGIDVLRLSEQELVWEGYSPTESFADILAGARRLHEEGARDVVVSRAAAPAIWISDGAPARCETGLSGPAFETLDASGTGDSMFAATAAGLARGMEMLEALRLGMAAGALNATRRGLGSGTREEIERLARHVDSFPLAAGADARD